jgi:hypothetical protein
MENAELNIPVNTFQNMEASEREIISKFIDNVRNSIGIFSIIFLYFAFMVFFYDLNLILKFFSFFEISNLIHNLNNFIDMYGMTAVITIIIAIFSGIYLYFRFFSNIQHNDFEDDMKKHLQFYEIFSSVFIDVTFILILFIYLLFFKHSINEFAVALITILLLNISITIIYRPFTNIIKKYSLIYDINLFLANIRLEISKGNISGKKNLKNFIFYIFMNNNSVLIILILFLTILIASYSIFWVYNLITLLILELVIIRFALLQSQVSKIPKNTINLKLINGDYYNDVYSIKETQEIFLILDKDDKFQIIPKRQINIFEIVKPFELFDGSQKK